ncbi:hypothetical protein ACGFIF_26770 [Kribbella sp. NPDC049174]|uniref:hypothetical protein n=1 Tax=Kribbella sp. NPDC049174 TaxID=3364112 RepID=UPI00371F68AA
MMTFEVTIRGADDVLGLQEPVARVMCPVEEHVGRCEVPWGFSVSDGGFEELEEQYRIEHGG